VPVVEVADAGHWAVSLGEQLHRSGVEVLVVHGFPAGTGRLLAEARRRGLATQLILYSSMAQHGGDAVEAQVVDEAIELVRQGTLGRLGFAKQGQAEAFAALGISASFVPNRVPRFPALPRLELGAGHLHVGVFAEPFWRKNVVTQLGAVALLDHPLAHVIFRPQVSYLAELPMVEHGLLPYDEFIRLQASVDLNLYVSLSEAMPITPLESYAAGVPCLISRTSALFGDDSDLWHLTTVDELDNPLAIARAAQRLLERKEEAVERARRWIQAWDEMAAQRWRDFVAT
jgi:glycosyltransferase involved in cell wall biosynthesis